MLATLLVIAALIGILAFPVALVICIWAHREK
jgi:ABC-type phosphate/phosphonate transport system permease subunit